ncbi:hypothetical protein ILYODFUR_026061 [Ilyodon furcidens]|uniref:Uncharacterized protein n=1 Tax=Ilyodon furcidens TaxID=33524 RepID=A0ABV0UN69_9TELE
MEVTKRNNGQIISAQFSLDKLVFTSHHHTDAAFLLSTFTYIHNMSSSLPRPDRKMHQSDIFSQSTVETEIQCALSAASIHWVKLINLSIQ